MKRILYFTLDWPWAIAIAIFFNFKSDAVGSEKHHNSTKKSVCNQRRETEIGVVSFCKKKVENKIENHECFFRIKKEEKVKQNYALHVITLLAIVIPPG